MPAPDPARPTRRTFQPPKGTRDFYPQDLLRRRYVEKAWRDASIRHGFEEIEGPTIEQADLYAVKSGEGILGEMFNVFSGKDPEEVAQVRESGRAPLALRPEFTPTLARMYAARARQLPAPTRWFTAGPYFRAEKPQRGRLREFCQWNCDVIGVASDDREPASARADVDAIAPLIDALRALGFTEDRGLGLVVSDRACIAGILTGPLGLPHGRLDDALQLADQREKLGDAEFRARAGALGLSTEAQAVFINLAHAGAPATTPWPVIESSFSALGGGRSREDRELFAPLRELHEQITQAGLAQWVSFNLGLARGLAYYTGTVFELRVTGERAVCGGGRYDDLIELFGGPPTPAVGFGMGDVVLGNLLSDRGLMPEGPALLEALSAPPASLRPDVFVIANEQEESQRAVRPLVARLRRGVESPGWLARPARKPWDRDRYAAPPLHARLSSRATRNIGKLLQEASGQHARFAAIIESADDPATWTAAPAGACTLKNLDTREERRNVPLGDVARCVSGVG